MASNDQGTESTDEQPTTSAGGMSLPSETTQADSNPAFYPKEAKSEALHGEAEKAGLDYPGPIIDPEDADQIPVGSPMAQVVADVGDGSHAGEGSSQTPEQAQAAADQHADAPGRNASTEDWRTYAVSGAPEGERMTQEEADAYSRDELAQHYLGDA